MATEFKAGDRVRHKGASVPPGVVLAPPDSAGDVPWTDADGDHFIDSVDDLELIPDTVTVTVELPRDEATVLAQEATSIRERFPADDEAVPPATRAYRRLRDAAGEALA